MSEIQKFLKMFFSLLDSTDKKKFYLITLLVFISSILSLLSVGALLPFLSILLSPEKNKLSYYMPGCSSQSLLSFSVLLLIITYWIKNIAAWICLFVQTKLLNEISFKIGRRLFAKYMHASYLWHLNQSTPDLIRNINNESITFCSVMIGFGSFITEFCSSLLLILALLFVDFKFTLAIIVSLSISILIFLRFNLNKTKFYAENRVTAWSKMVKYVMQGLGGLKETIIYHKENYFLKAFNQQSQMMSDSSIFSTVFQQTPRFFIELTAITVVLVTILFFIHSGYSNQQMLILISIMSAAAVQLLPSLNRMMQGIAQIKYGMPSLNILHNELKENSFVHVKNDSSKLELSFNDKLSLVDICFSYQESNARASDSITLEIKKGEKIAFMGYSGAGKTTIADVILGLLEPQKGKILVDGVEITQTNRAYWQNQLGYVPQIIYLYDYSIRENVAFAEHIDEIDDAKVWQALEISNLKSFVETLPQGLNTLIGENGIRLSGGQRQRLGIARAIYRDPKVLIMDEATSSLDNQIEKEVIEAIHNASSNRTMITITHRVSTIKRCHKIFLFKQGNLIDSGSYESLFKTSSYFRKIIGDESIKLLLPTHTVNELSDRTAYD